VQPWRTAAVKAPLGMPSNAATQRRYSGINVLILWGAVIERGFSGQSWLTFRQALGLGGHIRKGERGTTVVYADRFTPEGERRRATETGEEPGTIPFLKRFTVLCTQKENTVTLSATRSTRGEACGQAATLSRGCSALASGRVGGRVTVRMMRTRILDPLSQFIMRRSAFSSRAPLA
jgi:antirestriction protein ArdC